MALFDCIVGYRKGTIKGSHGEEAQNQPAEEVVKVSELDGSPTATITAMCGDDDRILGVVTVMIVEEIRKTGARVTPNGIQMEI